MAEPIPIHRTEDEALGHAGIAITLGGRGFTLRPLTMAEVKAWKATYATWDAWAQSLTDLSSANLRSANLAHDRTERMLDMLLAYDVDTTLGGRDAVESIATPDEIEEAYAAVRRAALPFVRHMTTDPDLRYLVAELEGRGQALLEAYAAIALLRSQQDSSPSSSSATSPDSEPGETSSES